MSRIVVNPEILGGKPIIEGTRLSVEHVWGLLNSGMSTAEIIANYPVLNEENLQVVRTFVSERTEASRRTDASQALRNGVIIDLPITRDRVEQCYLRLSLT
jgi:uncharacterized protein (DUF433 family)